MAPTAGERKGKRRQCGDDGGGVAVGRAGRWAELSAELLGEICSRLAADETSRAVPFVCKAWRDAARGPYCWAVVDVDRWCRRVDCTEKIDAAVRRLVRCSAGSLQRLSAFKLGNSAFCFAADRGRCLRVLHMPMSEVTDEMAEKCAASFAMLVDLDISYCLKITSKGIEAFGKNCGSLVKFRRNMPPPETGYGPQQDAVPPAVDDREALAVASTMVGLQHLELAYSKLGDQGLNAIVGCCSSLLLLDICGCWSVILDGDLDAKCDQIPRFIDPWSWEDYYHDVEESSSGGDAGRSPIPAGQVESDDSEWFNDSDWDSPPR